MDQLREKIDLTRESVWYNTNDVKRIYEKLDTLNDRVLKLEAQFKESGVVTASNPTSGFLVTASNPTSGFGAGKQTVFGGPKY